jgi:hypothetical protein
VVETKHTQQQKEEGRVLTAVEEKLEFDLLTPSHTLTHAHTLISTATIMFESIVAYLLSRILGYYFEDIRKENIKFSLSGDLVLKNLIIKVE